MKYTTKIVLAFWLALVSMAAPANIAQAQLDEYGRWENGVTEPWWADGFSKEELGVVQSLWRAIGAENQDRKTHEWAGDYFVGGDTHGTYMRWSPRAGFIIAHVDKCQAKLMGLTYGRVKASPTLVRFFPEFSRMDSASHGHSQSHSNEPSEMRFLTVKGHGDNLLVAEPEIREFGDYVAGLGRYNDPYMFLWEQAEFFTMFSRKATTEAQASQTRQGAGNDNSPFVVPPGYERYLKAPIDARIVAVGSGYRKINENEWWDDFIIPVTINVGSLMGVKREMALKMIGSKGFGGLGEAVIVKRVGKRSARGVIVRTIRKEPCVKFNETDDCKNPVYEEVKVGRYVTTNPFY